MAKEGSSMLKPSDPGSPFYLASSDSPGIMLTTVMLQEEANYENWAKLMQNALKAKNKIGFVTGSVEKPEKKNAAEWRAWEMCNSKINGWIHNTIDPSLQPFIKCFDEVKDLWDDLKERYAVQNFSRKYQLKASLASMRQQGSSIGAYYTKLRAIWDELEGSKSRKTCACGDNCAYAKEIEEEREHDRVYQFLMGLDESTFGNLRSQILNNSPLPSVNKVYAAVTQEETHRNIARNQEERGSVVGYAAQAATNVGKENTMQRMVPDKQIERILCPHCGKTNHDPSRCWKIIGYPPTRGAFRGRGRGRTGGRYTYEQAHAMQTPENSQDVGAFSVLTPEVVNKLLTLVDQPQTSDKLSGKNIHSQWLIDSGASQHMTGRIDILTNDQTSTKETGLGNLQAGVYVFQSKCASVSVVRVQESVDLWHKRLGHPSYEVTSLLPIISNSAAKFISNKACDAGLPVDFWEESVLAGVHLINRTPSKVLGGCTPYEALYEKAPTYDHLRIFGCLCFDNIRPKPNDKFAPRSRKCILMGYPVTQKGWKLYDLETKEYFICRDVQFHEDSFPFVTTPINDSRHASLPSLPATIEAVDPTVMTATFPEEVPSPAPAQDHLVEIEEGMEAPPREDNDDRGSRNVPSAAVHDVGRQRRPRRAPTYLNDYECNKVETHELSAPASPPSDDRSGIKYPLQNYVSLSKFSPNHHAFVAAIDAGHEPRHLKEAMRDSQWVEAMRKEITALEDNGTWTITNLPTGK
ncbi:uncharacterized protein LOC133309044 [Gastrolobium bilobum]|uniref:uncharacterized protein LOC133309044 n=1 Tax=Gastrolobium bilobum TaxID=150636 RepID=UPI002AAFE74D|nr:uncharacterized protein LOC133309044 [Gastrolobium bilobum]